MLEKANPNVLFGIGIALAILAPVVYFLIFHDKIMRGLAMDQAFGVFGGIGTETILYLRGIQLAHLAVFAIGSFLAYTGWKKRNANA